MFKINLQEKAIAKRGVVSYYWFENETIKLTKTLFHKIEIPLTSFVSGLEYESEPTDTIIVFDWLNFNLKDPSNLDGIMMSTRKGSEEEISVYVGAAHNPCDINRLQLKRIEENSYSMVCEIFIDFEHEGVAKNEIFKFETIIDFKENKSA